MLQQQDGVPVWDGFATGGEIRFRDGKKGKEE
jgi:hypothetical protein